MSNDPSIAESGPGGNGVPVAAGAVAASEHAPSQCEACGQPVRVKVLEGYADAQPVTRSFCLQCVENSRPLAREAPSSRQKLGVWIVPALIGVGLGMTALLTDPLIPDAAPGFGLYQRSGLVLGALLGLVGVLLRVDVIVIAGMFVFVGALSADWFGLARSPGFGWKQRAVLGLSLFLVLSAVLTHLAQHRSRSNSASKHTGNSNVAT